MKVITDGIIYGLNPGGGITRYWTEMIWAMSRLKLPVSFDVVVPTGAKLPTNVVYRTLGSLSSYFAAMRADFFHSTYYTKWPRLKCPSVVTVYDFVDASYPLLRPNGEGFVDRQFETLRQSSAVISISNSTREMAISRVGISPSKIFVAYPGVSEPFSHALPSKAETQKFRKEHTGGAPFLVHVGHRQNYKNFKIILRAFCRVASSMDRHLLIIGGNKNLTEDELDLIFSSRVMNRIHFYSQFDDFALRLAYASSDAMVHASRMEGFGIPVIEALSCGTGLILSDIPVYREIAEGQATFVDVDNVEAWEHALMSEVAFQQFWRDEVLKQYTWDLTAQAHARAYESILQAMKNN